MKIVDGLSFITTSKDANLDDREVFTSLLKWGLTLSNITYDTMTEKFKTAPGTVSRWVNGHSAPQSFARKTIISFLQSKVFCSTIVHAIKNNIVTEKELQREFGISKPTMRRWLCGENAPHPVFMIPVIRFLFEQEETKKKPE